MLKKTIQNKLIAQFMGLIEYSEQHDGMYCAETMELDDFPILFKDGSYDSSWDWLMPVIKKCLIGQTEVSRGLTNTNVSRILDGLCYQDMSRTYNAVVEFIKDDNNGKDK